MTAAFGYTPEVWPAVATLGLLVYLGLYSWRLRRIAGARTFAVACALGVAWLLGVVMEILAAQIPAQIFWHRFQAVWPLTAAATITCFVLQFAGLDAWLNRRTCGLLFLVPLLNALAVVTNPLHHLVWTGFAVPGHVVPLPGPLYWVFNSYVYLLGLANLTVLAWLAVRSPGHRWPVFVILCGQLMGSVGYALDKLDTGWLGPGESAFLSVGVVALAYAIAFLGFHIIDPVTEARGAILDQMREGMIVLDREGRILDVNAMGASILGAPKADLRGLAAAELLGTAPEQPDDSDGLPMDSAEIALGGPGPERVYAVNRTLLRDRQDEPIGDLLLLHDISEQRRAQAQLIEEQGVVATLRERERLARELHDGIGQTFGYAAMQTQAALQWVRSGRTDKAEAVLLRLIDVVQDAHSDVRESILGLKADCLEGWSFIPSLRRYLEKYQAIYGIRMELSLSEDVGDQAFPPAVGSQLLRVLQEALSNTRRHGHAGSVRVAIARQDDRLRVTVTDDGIGFDSEELVSRDGAHFGIGFMRERMALIGGTLEIRSRPGAGTVLMLETWIQDLARKAG